MTGRFAQARGASAWAQSFNASSRCFFSGSARMTRPLSGAAINFAQCLGESPTSGFAEQFRAVTQTFAVLGGQSGSVGDFLAGDEDAQVEAGSVLEELEFLQTADMPTLFTYSHIIT